jgi:hypothetical protein
MSNSLIVSLSPQDSALVVIEEEHGAAAGGEEETDETLMLIRRGPQEPALQAASGAHPVVSGTEVSASSSGGDTVRTNVGVLAGRWFFEAKVMIFDVSRSNLFAAPVSWKRSPGNRSCRFFRRC